MSSTPGATPPMRRPPPPAAPPGKTPQPAGRPQPAPETSVRNEAAAPAGRQQSERSGSGQEPGPASGNVEQQPPPKCYLKVQAPKVTETGDVVMSGRLYKIFPKTRFQNLLNMLGGEGVLFVGGKQVSPDVTPDDLGLPVGAGNIIDVTFEPPITDPTRTNSDVMASSHLSEPSSAQRGEATPSSSGRPKPPPRRRSESSQDGRQPHVGPQESHGLEAQSFVAMGGGAVVAAPGHGHEGVAAPGRGHGGEHAATESHRSGSARIIGPPPPRSARQHDAPGSQPSSHHTTPQHSPDRSGEPVQQQRRVQPPPPPSGPPPSSDPPQSVIAKLEQRVAAESAHAGQQQAVVAPSSNYQQQPAASSHSAPMAAAHPLMQDAPNVVRQQSELSEGRVAPTGVEARVPTTAVASHSRQASSQLGSSGGAGLEPAPMMDAGRGGVEYNQRRDAPSSRQEDVMPAVTMDDYLGTERREIRRADEPVREPKQQSSSRTGGQQQQQQKREPQQQQQNTERTRSPDSPRRFGKKTSTKRTTVNETRAGAAAGVRDGSPPVVPSQSTTMHHPPCLSRKEGRHILDSSPVAHISASRRAPSENHHTPQLETIREGPPTLQGMQHASYITSTTRTRPTDSPSLSPARHYMQHGHDAAGITPARSHQAHAGDMTTVEDVAAITAAALSTSHQQHMQTCGQCRDSRSTLEEAQNMVQSMAAEIADLRMELAVERAQRELLTQQVTRMYSMGQQQQQQQQPSNNHMGSSANNISGSGNAAQITPVRRAVSTGGLGYPASPSPIEALRSAGKDYGYASGAMPAAAADSASSVASTEEALVYHQRLMIDLKAKRRAAKATL